jgi:hypothetical protein
LPQKSEIPPTVVGGFFKSFLLRVIGRELKIPPTEVGGLFRSFLQGVRKLQERDQNAASCGRGCVRQDLNYPPTAVGGIFRSPFRACPYRKDLKNPPTAVGGIFGLFEAKLFQYIEFKNARSENLQCRLLRTSRLH